MPRVPPGGLHENSRKQLQHKRDCTNQILKAAMAINSTTLAEMEVPESYLEVLPKVLKCCCYNFQGELDQNSKDTFHVLLFALGFRMENQA